MAIADLAWIWIPITLWAAFAQTIRNATQRHLVAGLGTTFDDQARAAGMINVAARHGLRGHNAVSLEQLTTWDPDLIVTPCQGDCTAARERVASLPGLHVTKAARAGRIVAIESRILFSTGLDMVGVVERLRGNR